MTNAMKAVESVKSGMTVREALKKHKVPVGAYYKAKKAQATLPAEEAISAKTSALEELYGVVSVEVYIAALKDIGEWAKKNGHMQAIKGYRGQ